MSRKHYVAVAAMLAGEYAMAHHAVNNGQPHDGKTQLRTLDNVTRSLADMFKQDNSRFDRGRFYTAAGSDLIA
jgi:hypothetical protein